MYALNILKVANANAYGNVSTKNFLGETVA